MSWDTLLAFSLFAMVTSITPGPNNLMLLASGVNFGFRPTVPHMLGISSGFLVMAFAVGVGLAGVFTQLPWLYGVLKWVGTAYMLYLAWRIANSAPPEDTAPGKKPIHGVDRYADCLPTAPPRPNYFPLSGGLDERALLIVGSS